MNENPLPPDHPMVHKETIGELFWFAFGVIFMIAFLTFTFLPIMVPWANMIREFWFGGK
ncbi:hypothetical protein LCGC14_2499170 [marine sediment metagenome]|uniref:Uncharacterized protein n=1 Tax=marine sediment metagenome TaxID=412755 RepID=A0A0F9DE74_9ZZZZ